MSDEVERQATLLDDKEEEIKKLRENKRKEAAALSKLNTQLETQVRQKEAEIKSLKSTYDALHDDHKKLKSESKATLDDLTSEIETYKIWLSESKLQVRRDVIDFL